MKKLKNTQTLVKMCVIFLENIGSHSTQTKIKLHMKIFQGVFK